MSSINLNGKSYEVSLKKVAAGQEAAVMAAAKKNGADDLLVKVGTDTFLASGRGMPVNRVKAGVTLDGREAKVLDKNAELNTFGEGMRHPLGALIAAPFWVVGAVIEANANLGGGMTLRGAGFIIAAIGGVFGLASNLPAAMQGAFRKIDAVN